jgi:alcohol dehydrogenase class IV
MKRPLVVTDQGSRGLPFVEAILADLRAQGMAPGLFAEIAPNPRDIDVEAGRRVFRDGDHDGVVALGGGSGMDGGKAICAVARSDRDLWDFDFDRTPPDMGGPGAFAPLVCVPTTAGTGAETESTAMVTDTGRGMKLCVWHPDLKPAAAILDPEITVGLPTNLTAWTGCDALVHAIEAYCVPDWHPMCDGIALEAMRLIYPRLPEAVRDGGNLEARGAMLVGSCLAGISFLKGLGLVHAMSHMVGAVYDTHHGLTNAVLLPAVLRFNEASIGDRIAPMCQALDLEGHDFATLYRAVTDLLDHLEIPANLKDLGVEPDRVQEIARKAHTDAAMQTTPRPATVEEIEALLNEAMDRGR